MGLIKAAFGAMGSTLADQWKEYFCCDSLDGDVLVARGEKRINGRSSNTKGNDNVITDGSNIAVAVERHCLQWIGVKIQNMFTMSYIDAYIICL